jgi:outer membrane lipoprotein SlyB
MAQFMRSVATMILISLLAAPAMGKELSKKEEARVARADPRDRDDVRYCLQKQSGGKKTGTIAGAAGGAGVSVLAGGGVGETALAAGAGALVGRAIGNGTSTNKTCDEVLAKNK